MNSLDTRMGATAQRLIGKFGTTITITSPGATFNPSTRVTTGTGTSVTVKATISPSRARFVGADGEVQAEKLLTVARLDLPEGFVPAVGHKVRVGSAAYVVAGVDKTFTGDLVATYGLHVRR